MKKILIGIISICALSCSKPRKEILGKWKSTEYIENGEKLNVSSYFIEFKLKNEIIVTGDGRPELKQGKVTYEIKEDTIFISLNAHQQNGLPFEKESFKYELLENDLTLYNNGGGITYFKRVVAESQYEKR